MGKSGKIFDQKRHFLVTYSETLPNQKHCQNSGPRKSDQKWQIQPIKEKVKSGLVLTRNGQFGYHTQKHCQILSFQTILDPENVPEFRPYYNFSVPELAVYYHFLDPKTANSPANYCIVLRGGACISHQFCEPRAKRALNVRSR